MPGDNKEEDAGANGIEAGSDKTEGGAWSSRGGGARRGQLGKNFNFNS